MTILIEAWMAHEGYAEDCWRLEGWLQSGKINKMTEAPLRGYMCPTEINISLKLLLRANQETIEGSKLHIYEKPSSCRYTRLTMPKKKLVQTWLIHYTYAPIGAYQFLKTCRQYIAKFAAMVYSLYVLLGRGRGRWHNIPALWCLSGTRACRQDNWSPGVDEVHMVPWWCPKKSNFGISSVRGCVLEKSRRNSSWKKMSSLVTFVWWVFCDVMGPLTVCIVTMSGSQVFHIQYSST